MPKKLTKPRPKQGARLAELRKAAGLSQYELAAMVAEPQANIALWERSTKPPRSDALPKLAKALGVNIKDLIVGPSTKLNSFNKQGPAGKVRRAFDRVLQLPRRQQDKMVEIILFCNQFDKPKS